MRTLITAIILSLLLIHPILADEKGDLLEITRGQIGKVIELLKNKKLEKMERNRRIIKEVNPFFDFGIMAKLSLRKTHRNQMTPAQKKEFFDLFVKRLQESYLEKLDLYTDEKVVIEKAVLVKKRIHILTHLISKDDKKEMIYKFYKSRRGWKVYDVEILGVSVVQTYRSQFDGLLKKGGVEDMLTRLRKTGGITIPAPQK